MAESDIVLITGANTGLGYEMVRALCESSKPYTILLGCRSQAKGQEAADKVTTELTSTKSTVHVLQVDLESDISIEKAFAETEGKWGRLDALVNNGGASFAMAPPGSQPKFTEREIWNKTWDVNVAGTQVMTSTFVPLLLKSSSPRLIFMTSGTANLTESGDTSFKFNQPIPRGEPKVSAVGAYRSTKVGLNMMMREWHRMLEEEGVRVWSVSPGMLATNLGGVGPEALKKMGAGDPAIAGQIIRGMLEGKRDEDVGKVVRQTGIQSW